MSETEKRIILIPPEGGETIETWATHADKLIAAGWTLAEPDEQETDDTEVE